MADHLKTLIDNTPEGVLGGGGLVIFLILAYGIGRLLSAFGNARFTQAWGPLVSIINGTILSDSSAAVFSRLTGTYGGRKVEAEMTPGRNKSSLSSMHIGVGRYNEFEIRVLGVSGRADWHVAWERPLLGKAGWTITADEPLRQRLEGLDVCTTLERMGGISLRYQAQPSLLEYRMDITPRWAPTPERFQADLDALLPLAAASEKINL